MDREIERACEWIDKHPGDAVAYNDVLTMVYEHIKAGEKEWHGFNKEFRKRITGAMRQGYDIKTTEKLNGAYRRSLLMDARDDFDSFMLYLEQNRAPEDRFYLPRRKVLLPIVKALQDVHDGNVDLLTVSMPKRVGKSTISTWFVLFRSGNSPNGSTVCAGAGDGLVKSFYNGMLDVLTQKDKYLFYDVFPEAQLVQTNADEKIINLKDRKRFATITCRSIDGQITGSTEATPDGLLYLDDLVKDEYEAVNRDRLDFLWDKLRGDVLGRRLEGCPILAVGTRYSLYDPLGRLQEVAPSMGWRTNILEIPALNDNDESNFEVTLKGKKMFSTEHFRHERTLVTPMQWESQFQQHPFEAKGRLFPEESLNRYFELPIDRDPDAVIAVCDTAEKGTDSVMMPIAYIYGDDVFIEDCVFNNGTPQYTKPECANMLVKHNVSTATFESNAAGEYFARDVEELVRGMGHRISIRTKRTITNKQNRIENASDGILKHFFFKDRSLYTPMSEYGMMIRELTGYTRSGKVKHDDAPDGLSLLENELRRLSSGKVEVIMRPW